MEQRLFNQGLAGCWVNFNTATQDDFSWWWWGSLKKMNNKSRVISYASDHDASHKKIRSTGCLSVGRRTNHRLICWCDKQLYKCFREHQQICVLQLFEDNDDLVTVLFPFKKPPLPFFVDGLVFKKIVLIPVMFHISTTLLICKKMKLFSQILAMLFDVLTSLLLVLKQNGLKFLGCLIDALHTLSYVRKIPAWKIC